MKRLFFLLLFILFVSGTTTADSIDSTQVRPGVIHYHEYRDSGPWNFNIIKIDLTNDWLKVETVKANDLLKAHEKTYSVAARNDYEMHRVVGAVNGDFYDGNGTPIGTQVINGEILKSANDWGTLHSICLRE